MRQFDVRVEVFKLLDTSNNTQLYAFTSYFGLYYYVAFKSKFQDDEKREIQRELGEMIEKYQITPNPFLFESPHYKGMICNNVEMNFPTHRVLSHIESYMCTVVCNV